MSDKLQPPVGNSWAFQGFPRTDHTFTYDQQARNPEGVQPEFQPDATRQSAPFMQNFLPRLAIPFSDFTDYQRFNGFQRNTFLTAPFAPPFPNPPFPQTFPLNTGVPTVDSFNFPHGPSFMQNSLPPLNPIPKRKSVEPVDDQEKPPILSVEYPVKQEPDLKFDIVGDFPVIPKEEPVDDHVMRNVEQEKKKDDRCFVLPPNLPINKHIETDRIRDEVLNFNTTFYPPPLDMHVGTAFKQELMITPPNLDTQIDFQKFNADPANGKRVEFPVQGALHDCQVCLSTHANGLHFGARTCAACAAFFRRTISDDKRYVCKRNQRCTNASRDGTGYRKICRSCRMKRCLEIGMLPENVQHKRNRRDSGSPPRKTTTFDTFFNGFYPPFPAAGAPIPPIALPPTDALHPLS